MVRVMALADGMTGIGGGWSETARAFLAGDDT
jgi:hypothetical protein